MEQSQRGRGGRGRGRGREGGVSRGGGSGYGGGRREGSRTTAPVEPICQPSTSGSLPRSPSLAVDPEIASLSSDVLRQLHIELVETPVSVAPSSAKSIRPPLRPGFGTLGTKVTVATNHFPVKVSLPEIFHYDVAITPEVKSKAVNLLIFQEFIQLYGSSHLNRLQPVYDRSKSLYTAHALPFNAKEFDVELEEEGRQLDLIEPLNTMARKFRVVIKRVGYADLTRLQKFLRGQDLEDPKEAIHALDVVLRQTPFFKYVPVSRSFFSPSLGGKGDAGNGIDYWMGFYSSLRPTQMGLSLNIDISATSFFQPILVTEFVIQYLNIRDVSRPLNDADRLRIKKALKGVKVRVTHRGEAAGRYRINGLSTASANSLTFSQDNSEANKISVAQYFKSQYNMQLKRHAWPCIIAGSDKKPIYLPMEVCQILEGQRYTKKLNENQVRSILRATCQRPNDRERSIYNVVKSCKYSSDKFAIEFGMSVSHEPCTVEGRVLPPPMLKYGDSGQEKQCRPNMGQWSMMNKRMVDAGTLKHWAYLNLSFIETGAVENFFKQLGFTCQQMGMSFNPRPLIGISMDPRNLGQALAQIHGQTSARLKASNERFQLLIVVLPDRGGSCYGQVKRICETLYGIVSQCVHPRNIHKCSKSILENLSLKVNVKVNGRNTVLVEAVNRTIPQVSDIPTIIFGADVTHPAPGEDSSPSIAAVVACVDSEMTNYRCLISAQTHRQEIIKDLFKPSDGGMIRKHLVAFYKKTNRKPFRIIFYRDGVSEGQFNEVLLYEMHAIRQACQSMEEHYLPKVTFVVVQKRHHTRFFPRGREADRSGNVLPGTVVDTKICHPTQFDFYLCSHAGIQGTSRPTHYHVLYDENNFSADNLQMFTNKLCYTYNRCTRSVSIVPPAYYAHLAAARARHYIDEASDRDSSSSTVATREQSFSFTLPTLVGNVCDVMFYC